MKLKNKEHSRQNIKTQENKKCENLSRRLRITNKK